MPDLFTVHPDYAALAREVGLDAEAAFGDDRVHVWRSLPDRENATLDGVRPDGSTVRLHVKRYPASNRSAMAAEVRGHRLLEAAGLPTAPLVAHGERADGRTFAAFLDLAGYAPADKWLAAHPGQFDRLLEPTADLAAALHGAGLHHRDLYLCHFMIRPYPLDLRLIDVTRVGRLANPLTRRRWIVKDLAQFWYSTMPLGVTDAQRSRWLDRYGGRPLAAAVRRKAASIARHDERLNRKQPARNVSIPTGEAPDVHPGLR